MLSGSLSFFFVHSRVSQVFEVVLVSVLEMLTPPFPSSLRRYASAWSPNTTYSPNGSQPVPHLRGPPRHSASPARSCDAHHELPTLTGPRSTWQELREGEEPPVLASMRAAGLLPTVRAGGGDTRSAPHSFVAHPTRRRAVGPPILELHQEVSR